MVSATAIIIFGCGQNEGNLEEPAVTTDTENVAVRSQSVETVGEGASCAEKSCKSGLECSAEKVCFDPIVDKDLECPNTKAPICGEVRGEKNGYLNECHARRYGAKVLYEGFCE